MLLMPKSRRECNQLSESGRHGRHVNMRAGGHVHMSTCFTPLAQAMRCRMDERLNLSALPLSATMSDGAVSPLLKGQKR
jgi:hypothetical protein